MEKTELTVSLPADIIRKVEQDAQRLETSKSAVIRSHLRQVYPRPSEGEPDAS